MKKLYEIKGYLSTFKEEAPIIEIASSNNRYDPERLVRDVLDVGIADEAGEVIAKRGMEFSDLRKQQLNELRQVLEYYEKIYSQFSDVASEVWSMYNTSPYHHQSQ